MCTVFAESEVVSLIAQNKDTDDIVHGLNKAVAVKTVALARRVGGEAPYMMTGGVSKNKGLVKTLEEKLAAALVSMLSLETAMLAQFGEDSGEQFRLIMTGLTGCAVCLIVLATAVVMLRQSAKQLKNLQNNMEMGESQ